MTIKQASSLFIRLNPMVAVHNSSHTGTLAEQTEPLASHSISVPPLTAMIRVKAVVTSTGGTASVVRLRDTPLGSDVLEAYTSVATVPAVVSGFLQFNGGAVTFAADAGSASSYTVVIYVTGFLRYA